ncbi:hypothetical protein L202_03192 [Cryptococcus amylolentus CBS 6039]|uniref:ELMO domain-containing protein n=1 Tax=Cryptococcus amylolentus CBS 6039 TaxID=1295533 RepID=A0A1E3HXW5_9TREE|nr:hypothetical protein L202_03192 [Cryptococcus amylolentus CBS 6039]ODN81097.1 hypothetical protein L202_03192 [Cryptococcus amylolentus CBS 6039]
MDDSAQPYTSKGAIPTNVVTYRGRRIPARIDPEARVAYIVEIMATSFATEEHHITLCLRDQEDNLVTQNNLPSKVYQHDVLKLCAAPTTEALIVVSSLKSAIRRDSLPESTFSHTPSHTPSPSNLDTIPLKLALFNLQKFVKEEDFSVEFLLIGGMRILIRLLGKEETGLVTGNSLAYALQGIRGILEFESGWSELSDTFIRRLLSILLSATQPNILRPATAILRKLVISSPSPASTSASASASAGADLQSSLKPSPGYFLSGGSTSAKDRYKKNRNSKDNRHSNGAALESKHYGFDRVYSLIKSLPLTTTHPGSGSGSREEEESVKNAEYFYKTLIKRLESTGDLELVAQSLGLINASLRSGHQEGSPQYYELIWILENLGIKKYVARLTPSSQNPILAPHLLNFQSRLAVILQHKRLRSVRPGERANQEKMLGEIWEAGRLGELEGGGGEEIEELKEGGGVGGVGGVGLGMGMEGEKVEMGGMRGKGGRRMEGWVAMGGEVFGELGEGGMFRDVGELGLECLHYFATHEERFYNLVLEENAKPPSRRCPLIAASASCVKLLAEHYKLASAPHYPHPPKTFQPFLLGFPKLHSLVLKFFIRMFHQSSSSSSDLARLLPLVGSHLALTLNPGEEREKTWLDVENAFLHAEYGKVRERQMEMMEREGGMWRSGAVRGLKEVVGREVWGVVCEQRVGCMLQGSWFNSATLLVPGITTIARPIANKPHRFLRLSEDRRTIAWDDFHERIGTPTLNTLTRRINVADISTIRPQTSAPINSRSPNLVSKLSFSIIAVPSSSSPSAAASLLDVDAIHAAQMAEWTDGIRVVKDGGMVDQDSANYVQILTELALNVRLLDITGDGAEIPAKVSIGVAPRSTDFVFAK